MRITQNRQQLPHLAALPSRASFKSATLAIAAMVRLGLLVAGLSVQAQVSTDAVAVSGQEPQDPTLGTAPGVAPTAQASGLVPLGPLLDQLTTATGNSALGLKINPTFDSSITSDPNAATIMNTINSAIAVYEAKFNDQITVNITFKEKTTGLGGSFTILGTIPYSSYLSALQSHATTANDATALAHLPAGPNNPVNGSANIQVATANLRALGFDATPSGGQDSTISLNVSICNLDRVTIDPNKYDLKAVVMHEIDEALSLGSAMDNLNNGDPAPTLFIRPADLFRYDSSGNRSFDTALATQSFFSIDGTTDLARFNQTQGGDFGDWYSPGGQTPQVQDAFATAGATPDPAVELTRLDVVGYTLGVPGPLLTIPGNVTFPDTCVGSTSTATLNVCNTGTTDLQVGQITSTNSQFAVTTPSSGYPVTISPNFCFPFQVTFTPTSPGPKSTTFSIPSNQPISPTTVQGSGNVPTPTISTTGSGTFGTVCLGGPSAQQVINICNVGGCPLHVFAITFATNVACVDFSLVNPPLLPVTVAPGSCLPVTIAFTPTSCGQKSCTLIIGSDDPVHFVSLVPVTANLPCPAIDVPQGLCFPPTVIQSIGKCSTALPFPISNKDTNCNLVITSISIVGTNASDFSFSGLPSFPVVLLPGHQVGEGNLQVVFAPTILTRTESAAIAVTYISDPAQPATTTVFGLVTGEGVRTGARVLVTANGVAVTNVAKIQLNRINANRNKNLLDTQDVVQNAILTTVIPGFPCQPFQYQREYGTVSNPIQLLPGSYQVTVSVVINGKRQSKTVGFNLNTCDFNPNINVQF
jgi:hypothetical protein